MSVINKLGAWGQEHQHSHAHTHTHTPWSVLHKRWQTWLTSGTPTSQTDPWGTKSVECTPGKYSCSSWNVYEKGAQINSSRHNKIMLTDGWRYQVVLQTTSVQHQVSQTSSSCTSSRRSVYSQKLAISTRIKILHHKYLVYYWLTGSIPNGYGCWNICASVGKVLTSVLSRLITQVFPLREQKDDCPRKSQSSWNSRWTASRSIRKG